MAKLKGLYLITGKVPNTIYLKNRIKPNTVMTEK